MLNLRSFWIKKMSKFLSYTLLIFLTFNFNITKSFSNNLEMSEATIQKMVIEAQKHAIETLKLEPNEKSLKIELLIKKYINLDFMSKATTGTFWKKASKIQKEKYKAALLKQITLTIEEHLNTLATLSYIPINSEKRGKKLIYVKGLIRDPNKRKSDVNILWKLAANKNGSFLILDLEIEGVSLVSSQKAEAVSILRKNRGNFDILLNKMTRDN